MVDPPEEAHELLEWSPELLTPEQIAEIERRWPAIDAREVEGIAAGQKWDRENKPRPGAQMRDYLDKTGSLVRKLHRIVASPPGDLWAAMFRGERLAGKAGARLRAVAALGDLEDVLMTASRNTRVDGTPHRLERTETFADLKELITAAGYKANRSTNGPLIVLLQMIFHAIGEKADVYNVVDYQLKLEKRLPKS